MAAEPSCVTPLHAARPQASPYRLQFVTKQSQRDLIDRAAELIGKNRSDFMLETACREAESVLLDQRLFVLDDEAYAQFVARLNAPPKTNRKQQDLLETKAPSEK